MRKSTLRNVRRAIRAGVRVRVSQTIPSLRDFYRLNCLTRKHHGLPPQPWYFFEAIYKHVLKNRMGNVFIADLRGRPIAGAVFFQFNRQAHYKYGASDLAYQHCRANNLIMQKAIQHYHAAGFETVDFGRTEPTHDGLLQFKRGWGADEDHLYYYLFHTKRKIFVAQSQTTPPGNRFFKSLPLSVLRVIGHLLYPHVG